MDLRSFLKILRKHLVLILAAAFLGMGAGFLLYSRTAPSYAAHIQFYVSTPQPEGTNAQATGLFAQARVNSYVLLLASEEMGKRVIDLGGVDLTPGQVANRVRADADVNTVLVSVTITDTNPDRAFKVAQGIGKAFGPMVDTLDNVGRRSPLVVVNIVSGPTLDSEPVAPDLRFYLAVGLGLGLLLSITYAVLREVLDTSIRNSVEAADVTGVPVLGSIPFDAGVKKNPLISGEEALSVRAESFRKLRTSLQFIAAAQAADVVLITSALPQEGKSLTSVNLALSMVEFGHRTLLIDADMRKPQVSAYLGLDGSVGLSNVLAGQVDVDDAIVSWAKDGPDLLPSGSIPPNPSELLGSAKMLDLMTSLRPKYDHIIVDSPPVLPVTDAVVAGRLVDAVVLAIRIGKTSRVAAAHAAQALQAVKAPLVGTVLNMHRPTAAEGYYGGKLYQSDETATRPEPVRVERNADRTSAPAVSPQADSEVSNAGPDASRA